VANSDKLLVDAVKKLNVYPFILKPNRGGKGTGVQLFYDVESIEDAIRNKTIGESLDGLWLVQEYIKPDDGTITRVEFIGGKFLYAVKVKATDDFDLCPADSCRIDDSFCPVGEEGGSQFTIPDEYSNSDLDKYKLFFEANDIGIGALEYSRDKKGAKYVYDVNTNTNYNNKAELQAGGKRQGMVEIARFLTKQLDSC
jgi:biotin carboxylase